MSGETHERRSPMPTDADSAEITHEVRTHDSVIREVGDWVVHTFLNENGEEVQSVGYPKKPAVSREALVAAIEEDERYFAEHAL
jgi:hypothetical protein